MGQSRNEDILQSIIDGTSYTAPPRSRIEDLLIQLKEAIEAGGGQVVVDGELSTTSVNPVQNKVITIALQGKQDTLTAGDGISIEDGVISATSIGNLGALAYKDSASGSITPTGSVSVSVTPSTDTVNSITDVGTLPSLTENNGVLTFNAGTLPTKGSDTTVVTGISSASGSFSGTSDTVTVS